MLSAADLQLLGAAAGRKTDKLVRPLRLVQGRGPGAAAEIGGVNVQKLLRRMTSYPYILCTFSFVTACGAKTDLVIVQADEGVDAGVDAAIDAVGDVSSCGDGTPLTSHPRCDDPEFWSARPSLCYLADYCGSCVISYSQFMRPVCVSPSAVGMTAPLLV